MTAPRVVLFDLDDTLFAHRLAVANGVAAHRRATGGAMALADDAAELERWYALEEHHYHRYLAGEVGYQEQRRHRARDFAAPFGVELTSDASADAWFGRYLIEYERAWTLHEDAVPCLDELEARIPGVRLGVVTNAELPFQQAKMDTLGLTAHMEHIVASGEVGATKPDPRIFAHAVRLFGVDPAEAVYVGDRFETDALGAVNAGLGGVWLDRHDAATDDQRTIAAESGIPIIRTLAELPGLLAR